MMTVTGSISVSCVVSVSVTCNWGVARYSRERGCLVAFRDRRRDNDDATSDSITCSHVLIYVCISDGGAFGGAAVVSIVVRVGAVTFVTTVTICCDNSVDAW